MLLAEARTQEAAIEVVDEVATSPSSGASRSWSGRRRASPRPRDRGTRRAGRRIIAGYAMSWPRSRGSTREGARDVGELRVDDRRRERDDDPRPGPQRVVHHVEQERADDGVLLGLRREHALGDVAAAARLGARVPHRPPLDGERQDEHRERGAPVAEVGEQGSAVRAGRTFASIPESPPTAGCCSAKYATASAPSS